MTAAAAESIRPLSRGRSASASHVREQTPGLDGGQTLIDCVNGQVGPAPQVPNERAHSAGLGAALAGHGQWETDYDLGRAVPLGDVHDVLDVG